MAGEKVIPELQVISNPTVMKEVDCDVETISQVFPSCVVTRVKAREMKDHEESSVNLADTFMSHLPGKNVEESNSYSIGILGG